MAATLTVTYTPQYQGAHRICFRTTQTAYCCYLDQSLTIIGLPKTTQIDLTEFESCLVDPPAELGCVASTLNGYVQPACEASDSLADIVTFNVTYPNPTPCTPYGIQCNLSGVAEIQVLNPGYGWPSGDVPTVTITDLNGLGIDATATAVMRCSPEEICQVDSITIDTPGEFYYDPAVVIVDISLPPGSGIPAEAIVTAVENCGTFTLSTCEGVADPTLYEIRGGADYAINVCSGATPVAPNYSIKDTLISCCNCVKYEVKNTAPDPFDYYYTDCTDQIIKQETLQGNSTVLICAVERSAWVVNVADSQYFVLTVASTQDC